MSLPQVLRRDGHRYVRAAADDEQWYINVHQPGNHVVFYGPFATRREAMRVNFFRRSEAEFMAATTSRGPTEIRTYLNADLVPLNTAGKSYVLTGLKDEMGYASVSIQSPQSTALRMHRSWQEREAQNPGSNAAYFEHLRSRL